MEKSEIQKGVMDTIAEILDKPYSDIGLDENLSDELGVDSLDLVEIVMLLEEKYSLTLRDLNWACSDGVTARKISEDIYRLIYRLKETLAT